LNITIQIRVALASDSEQLRSLSRELGYPENRKAFRRRLETIIKEEDHLLFVAQDENRQVLGWIHGYPVTTLVSEPFLEIGGLVIAEESRGLGIGSKLLSALESTAINSGISLVRVRSRIMRKDAHRFYLDRGYELLKEQSVFVKGLEVNT